MVLHGDVHAALQKSGGGWLPGNWQLLRPRSCTPLCRAFYAHARMSRIVFRWVVATNVCLNTGCGSLCFLCRHASFLVRVCGSAVVAKLQWLEMTVAASTRNRKNDSEIVGAMDHQDRLGAIDSGPTRVTIALSESKSLAATPACICFFFKPITAHAVHPDTVRDAASQAPWSDGSMRNTAGGSNS